MQNATRQTTRRAGHPGSAREPALSAPTDHLGHEIKFVVCEQLCRSVFPVCWRGFEATQLAVADPRTTSMRKRLLQRAGMLMMYAGGS